MNGPPSQPSPQPGPASAPAPERPERCGPLAVRRQLKDDGRALILYERRHDAAS